MEWFNVHLTQFLLQQNKCASSRHLRWPTPSLHCFIITDGNVQAPSCSPIFLKNLAQNSPPSLLSFWIKVMQIWLLQSPQHTLKICGNECQLRVLRLLQFLPSGCASEACTVASQQFESMSRVGTRSAHGLAQHGLAGCFVSIRKKYPWNALGWFLAEGAVVSWPPQGSSYQAMIINMGVEEKGQEWWFMNTHVRPSLRIFSFNWHR